MNDYSENYLKLQRLMKSYHNATLKCDYELATQLAHELSCLLYTSDAADE